MRCYFSLNLIEPHTSTESMNYIIPWNYYVNFWTYKYLWLLYECLYKDPVAQIQNSTERDITKERKKEAIVDSSIWKRGASADKLSVFVCTARTPSAKLYPVYYRWYCRHKVHCFSPSRCISQVKKVARESSPLSHRVLAISEVESK